MSHSILTSESSSLLVRDAAGDYRPATAEEVLSAARQVTGRRVRRGTSFTSPRVARDFLWTKLGTLDHEVFSVVMLDAQHRLIEYVELFRGTIDSAAVYPREVVKEVWHATRPRCCSRTATRRASRSRAARTNC